MRVCIVGASARLGQYTIQHALDRGYEVVGVCREQSVGKPNAFNRRITVVPGHPPLSNGRVLSCMLSPDPPAPVR